jgi:carboxypeptidase C (cathepsin A)
MSETPSETPRKLEEGTPVIREHRLEVDGRVLDYTTTAGYLPVLNDKDEVEALVYYIAYHLNNVAQERRPLTFAFNGGPGAASVWLHLGALGPYRARMEDDGWMPPAPYELVANPYTWLDQTDLVFIDPVGTGFSHAVDMDTAKKYWDFEKDIDYLSEIIRLYLARSNRWTSPLFIAGESYGTMRAAGIAAQLGEMGVSLNGLMLISTTLNFQTLRFQMGNDLPYHLYLPSYTATAHYHDKLPTELQLKPLREAVAEAEDFAQSTYLVALAMGDALSDELRELVVTELARFTGLSRTYIERSNLRFEHLRFCKELLWDQGLTVGRLDSRFRKPALPEHAAEIAPLFDPSLTGIVPPYTSMMNHYVGEALGFETDRQFHALSRDVIENWVYQPGKYPDTSESLRDAMLRNPHMKVWVALGYYDLATPYLGTLYTIRHLGLPRHLRDNIHTTDYEAGHMMYLHTPSLANLKNDVKQFIQTTT